MEGWNVFPISTLYSISLGDKERVPPFHPTEKAEQGPEIKSGKGNPRLNRVFIVFEDRSDKLVGGSHRAGDGGATAPRCEAPLRCFAPLLQEHRRETSGFPPDPLSRSLPHRPSNTHKTWLIGRCYRQKKKAPRCLGTRPLSPRFDVFEVLRRSGRSPALPYPP